MAGDARGNRQAFDEVWFSTGVSFPSLAWHEEHARQCAKAAEDLRKLGIVPSIEIQTIIGHTDGIIGAGDCSGQDWGTMVSADGLPAKHLSCPRDPKLIAYFVRVAEMHAAWKPGSVWVDDDLSYRNRAPVPASPASPAPRGRRGSGRRSRRRSARTRPCARAGTIIRAGSWAS